MRKSRGFTLIEVMVTVAIVAILAAVGAPGLNDFLNANKVRAEAQRLSGLFSLARNHAVTHNQALIVYGTVTGSALDIDIYTDDGDATVTFETGNTYIQRSTGSEANLFYDSSAAVSADNAVLFDGKGRLNEAAAATINICSQDLTTGRAVSVNLMGRISISDINDPTNDCDIP